jgi:NADH:ubiquinone oxidoreductase subunit H
MTGYFSKSKYAFLASIRAAILLLNIEIFLGLLVLNLIFITESFCFSVFVVYQETI